MSLAVVGTVFPVIFISELPDKTMFASVVLATRGRALMVWAGAATAFAVHVCIAVTIGAALFTWLPQRAVQAVAAALFLGGAAWLLLRSADRTNAPGPSGGGPSGAEPADAPEPAGAKPPAALANAEPAGAGSSGSGPTSGGATLPTRTRSGSAGAAVAPDSSRRVFLTTFAVVFLAEWGDLTQILTASLAARFHDPVTVGVSAGLALWSVAALAVLAGRPLRRLPTALVRRLTGIVLLALAAFAIVAAATGS